MSYEYATERDAIFTEDGQRRFTKGRDQVLDTIKRTGAITMGKAMSMFGAGTNWFQMACVDRMVELADLIEVVPVKEYVAQYRVFLQKPTDR